MAVELTSIQEVVDSMCLLASEPCHLPASSQQVIDDFRHTQCKWFCQVCLCVCLSVADSCHDISYQRLDSEIESM